MSRPTGKTYLTPMITQRFPVEPFPDAYCTLREGTGSKARSS
jgi:hypothetical protein